ncbi:MAG: HNH endonuclease [Vulcanimicrobiaceae bacterium]
MTRAIPTGSAKPNLDSVRWRHKARLRGEVVTRPPGMPLPELLLRDVSRYNVKTRLLRAGLLENRCQECGLAEWRGKPLSVHIDHINGVSTDHRLENLRMLCPNCHLQTHTYGGRNAKRGRCRVTPACKDEPILCSIGSAGQSGVV